MARNTVVIQYTPGLALVALMQGRQVVASQDIHLDVAPETTFEDQLTALAPLVRQAVTTMNCIGAQATIIPAGVGEAGVFPCPFAAGSRAAGPAAMLALGELCQFPLHENPAGIQVAAVDDAAANPRQRHMLAGALPDEHARAIDRFCADAGLSLHRIVPLEVLAQRMCVQAIMSTAGTEPRGILWVGESRSVLACSAGGALRFVRVLSLGVSSLVDALTRPIKSRGADGAEITHALTRKQARALLISAGIPSPNAQWDNHLGIDASAILPLLQPALQRMAVEIKQSLRFGLTEQQRTVLRLHLDGPGSLIGRLATTLGTVSGVAASSDDSIGLRVTPGDGTPTVVSWPALERLQINLVPAGMSGNRALRRLTHAAWAGVIAAAGLVGFAGWSASSSLAHDRAELAAAANAAPADTITPAAMEQLERAGSDVRAAARRIASTLARRGDWHATLAAISEATPESFRLSRIELSDSDRGVSVILAGFASAPDEQSFAQNLREWSNRLSSSPLVKSVGLGSTGRASGERDGAAASHRFELTLNLHPLPGERTDPTLAAIATETP